MAVRNHRALSLYNSVAELVPITEVPGREWHGQRPKPSRSDVEAVGDLTDPIGIVLSASVLAVPPAALARRNCGDEPDW